jgi:hypothetical protein
MNESQKAFEAAYPHYDHRLGVDGKYHSRVSQDAYTYFTKGVAYGRKQAFDQLEIMVKNLERSNAVASIKLIAPASLSQHFSDPIAELNKLIGGLK